MYLTVAYTLAAISTDSLVNALVWLVVVALIFAILWWVISLIPIPAPFNLVIKVIFGLIAALIIINVLLGLLGHPIFS